MRISDWISDVCSSDLPSDRLARARYLIEAGQVESALAEVRRLPGAPRADRWITAAQHYVDSRRALDVIETAAILGQGGPAVPTIGAAAPDRKSTRLNSSH